MKTARAVHDLNDVTQLKIIGWAGHYEVTTNHEGPGVEIIAPVRHSGETWTFAQTRGGILECFSSLLGDKALRAAGPGLTMTVRIPKDKRKTVKVTVKK